MISISIHYVLVRALLFHPAGHYLALTPDIRSNTIRI